VIEIIGGIAGGLALLGVLKEYAFGTIGNAVVGAIGGAISGYFLQTVVARVVDSTGAANPDADPVTQYLLQGLGGIAAGGVLTMAVALGKHGLNQNRTTAGKRP
jgi:hypothetical protein